MSIRFGLENLQKKKIQFKFKNCFKRYWFKLQNAKKIYFRFLINVVFVILKFDLIKLVVSMKCPL